MLHFNMIQYALLFVGILNAMASDTGAADAIPIPSPALSATDGCRAPSDIYEGISCDSCCDQNVGDCQEYSGEIWYNAIRYLSSPTCSEACPKCASCSARDEKTLLELIPPVQCNPSECEALDIGVDPCFGIGSCECFCETANHLLQKCPQVKPDWIPQRTGTLVIDDTTVSPSPNTLPQCPPGEEMDSLVDPPACVAVSCDSSNACSADEECTSEPIFCIRAPCAQFTCKEKTAECPEERQCLAGDIMPSAPNSSAMTCCAEDEECVIDDLYPDMGGSLLTIHILHECRKAKKSTGLDQMQTVPWTIEGPWDLTKIQDESESLRMIFTQTLGVDPYTTMISVVRNQGTVQVTFHVTANVRFLEPLKSHTFRIQLEANILQANPDLADAMFINASDVMGFFVLEGPWELSTIQDFEEAFKAQFSFVLGTNPDQIEVEITTQNKVVQVIYKAKGSPQQLEPLYDAASFSRTLRMHVTNTNPPLAQALGWMVCPVQPPMMGSCFGTMKCDYGQDCCCGDCFPSMVFVCEDAKWEAMYSDACLSPICAREKLKEPNAGILQSPHGSHSDASDTKYIHFTLLITFGVVLGIFFGLLTQWLCSKKKVSVDRNNDLYVDMSFDTMDLARSV